MGQTRFHENIGLPTTGLATFSVPLSFAGSPLQMGVSFLEYTLFVAVLKGNHMFGGADQQRHTQMNPQQGSKSVSIHWVPGELGGSVYPPGTIRNAGWPCKLQDVDHLQESGFSCLKQGFC